MGVPNQEKKQEKGVFPMKWLQKCQAWQNNAVEKRPKATLLKFEGGKEAQKEQQQNEEQAGGKGGEKGEVFSTKQVGGGI